MRERTGDRGRRTKMLALAAGLVAAVDVAGPALAFGEELPGFGMIGLAQRQVAILNLVLTNPPDDGHPGCRVIASFVDARGQVFRNRAGDAVTRTFVLRPQVAAALVLRSADILADDELRKPIRAVLGNPPDDGTPSDCRCLIASRELVGAGGQTTASDVGTRPDDPGPPPPPPICTLTGTVQR